MIVYKTKRSWYVYHQIHHKVMGLLPREHTDVNVPWMNVFLCIRVFIISNIPKGDSFKWSGHWLWTEISLPQMHILGNRALTWVQEQRARGLGCGRTWIIRWRKEGGEQTMGGERSEYGNSLLKDYRNEWLIFSSLFEWPTTSNKLEPKCLKYTCV